jgi:hypothetical protein
MRMHALWLALLGMLGMVCDDEVPPPVLEWVQARDLASGTTHALELPPELRGASEDGKVVAARLSDGRLCVLLKTRIGFKDNFEAVVRCSAPLRAEEIVEDPERPYLSLSGHGIFEELYIRKRIGSAELTVYFDLH